MNGWDQCSNPPAESCADAGCPVHGDPLDEQSRRFPMADAEEISHEAIFGARRLTELDRARAQRQTVPGRHRRGTLCR
jgi:hypothetical protein